MSEFINTDDDELSSRMNTVMTRIDNLLKDIGPLLREIGALRLEADMLYTELKKRNLLHNESVIK